MQRQREEDARDVLDAHARGYITQRHAYSVAAAQWWRFCLRARRPFVCVRAYRTQGRVEMDLQTMDGRLTPAGQQRIQAVGRTLGKAVGFGMHIRHTRRIPIATAHALAAELTRILAEPGSVTTSA
jgi:hypothetical protein